MKVFTLFCIGAVKLLHLVLCAAAAWWLSETNKMYLSSCPAGCRSCKLLQYVASFLLVSCVEVNFVQVLHGKTSL